MATHLPSKIYQTKCPDCGKALLVPTWPRCDACGKKRTMKAWKDRYKKSKLNKLK